MEKLLRGRLAMRLMLIAVMRQRVNATTASIPGPTEPRYLAGARVLEVVPIVPLVANEPLAVAAPLYAGALTFGVAADRDAFPDLEVFATAMREELEALGISTTAAPVATSRRSITMVTIERGPGSAPGRRYGSATWTSSSTRSDRTSTRPDARRAERTTGR